MSTLLVSLFTLALLAGNSLVLALLFSRAEQHRVRAEELAGAILAALTAEQPLPIGASPEPAVLDARDLSDEQLFEEVLRRGSGHHDPEEQT